MSDKLTAILAAGERPATNILFELWVAWRAAAEDERRAWDAWCAGDAPHAAFVAALDREEAAAVVLAFCLRRSPAALARAV